jgi:hypothetical protein
MECLPTSAGITVAQGLCVKIQIGRKHASANRENFFNDGINRAKEMYKLSPRDSDDSKSLDEVDRKNELLKKRWQINIYELKGNYPRK